MRSYQLLHDTWSTIYKLAISTPYDRAGAVVLACASLDEALREALAADGYLAPTVKDDNLSTRIDVAEKRGFFVGLSAAAASSVVGGVVGVCGLLHKARELRNRLCHARLQQGAWGPPTLPGATNLQDSLDAIFRADFYLLLRLLPGSAPLPSIDFCSLASQVPPFCHPKSYRLKLADRFHVLHAAKTDDSAMRAAAILAASGLFDLALNELAPNDNAFTDLTIGRKFARALHDGLVPRSIETRALSDAIDVRNKCAHDDLGKADKMASDHVIAFFEAIDVIAEASQPVGSATAKPPEPSWSAPPPVPAAYVKERIRVAEPPSLSENPSFTVARPVLPVSNEPSSTPPKVLPQYIRESVDNSAPPTVDRVSTNQDASAAAPAAREVRGSAAAGGVSSRPAGQARSNNKATCSAEATDQRNDENDAKAKVPRPTGSGEKKGHGSSPELDAFLGLGLLGLGLGALFGGPKARSVLPPGTPQPSPTEMPSSTYAGTPIASPLQNESQRAADENYPLTCIAIVVVLALVVFVGLIIAWKTLLPSSFESPPGGNEAAGTRPEPEPTRDVLPARAAWRGRFDDRGAGGVCGWYAIVGSLPGPESDSQTASAMDRTADMLRGEMPPGFGNGTVVVHHQRKPASAWAVGVVLPTIEQRDAFVGLYKHDPRHPSAMAPGGRVCFVPID